jgi:homocysteine S-methyltransferase
VHGIGLDRIDEVIVLDGGLATELERRGNDLSGALWSARLLADRPDEIVAAHAAFFAAGADVATTASYQAARDNLGRDADELLRRSVALARVAAAGVPGRIVAASVGPYGAIRADGSEYRGDYGRSVAQLRRFHRPRLQVLAEAGPDLLAVETIPCLAELEAVLAELDDVAVPAWVSLTVAGDRTRAGEALADGFAMAAASDRVVAVGVNCSTPADATSAVALAARTVGGPLVVYPNSGESWDATARTWVGRAAFAAPDVRGWLAAGARLVGGCCRVRPAQIAEVARVARDAA